MRRRHPFLVPATALAAGLTTLAALAALTACGPRTVAAHSVQPATMQPIPGSSLHRVLLTAIAVQRLGIATAPVRAAGGPGLLQIPLTALIYDPEGRPWTYTVPAPRTYTRVAVTVDRVVGDTVLLRSGPPPGTPVVDVAAPELLGVEYGVGEE